MNKTLQDTPEMRKAWTVSGNRTGKFYLKEALLERYGKHLKENQMIIVLDYDPKTGKIQTKTRKP